MATLPIDHTPHLQNLFQIFRIVVIKRIAVLTADLSAAAVGDHLFQIAFLQSRQTVEEVLAGTAAVPSDIACIQHFRIREIQTDDIRQIVRIQMEILRKKLEGENVALSFTKAFEDDMVENGYDPVYGARPVKRLIQRELVNRLAREILEGKIHKDSAIEVDCVDGQTVLRNK